MTVLESELNNPTSALHDPDLHGVRVLDCSTCHHHRDVLRPKALVVNTIVI